MRKVLEQFAILFFLLCAAFFPQEARAHSDLHERIVGLNVQIKSGSTNSELYFQRGELHRLHGDWKLALQDFDAAEKRSPNIPQLNFARSKALTAAQRFNEAKAALDKHLLIAPVHADALALRGQTLVKLGDHAAAVNDFTRAIKNSAAPDHDYFLQRAESQIALNQHREALAGLDEGIQKIGPVISFQLRAIELEISSKNYTSALSRLDAIILKSPRKESWLAQRGEILEQAGRTIEAEKAFTDALNTLNALPPNRRNVSAMDTLETQIRSSLIRLKNFTTQSSIAR